MSTVILLVLGMGFIIAGCLRIGWFLGYRKGWSDRGAVKTVFDLKAITEARERILKRRFIILKERKDN